MPLPLLLAVPALIGVGAAGVKKGVDGVGHLRESSKIRATAAERMEAANAATERQRDITSARLQDLGETKFGLYDTDLRRFVEAFRQIKNADLAELADERPDFAGGSLDLREIREIDFGAVDVLKTVTVASGAGAAAGMVAFGAVGSFAAASTGTSIVALNGIAASNATLAWLGGGTLAAGGAGVAGGTMVLCGVVASPLLLVTGFALDAKGSKEVEKARSDAARVTAACSESALLREVMKVVALRAKRLNELLTRLQTMFRPLAGWTQELVEREKDYRAYSVSERERLMVATATALTLRHILDAPIVTAEGTVDPAAAEAVESAERLEDELSATSSRHPAPTTS